jgi:hypothetical protein
VASWPVWICLIEEGEWVGVATLYPQKPSEKSMPSILACTEIPVVGRVCIDRPKDQLKRRLWSFGLDPDGSDEREIGPILLLDECVGGQLRALQSAGQDSPKVDAANSLRSIPDFSGVRSLAAIPDLISDGVVLPGITANAKIGTAIADSIAQGGLRRRRVRSGL